jgi:hypothetical protein
MGAANFVLQREQPGDEGRKRFYRPKRHGWVQRNESLRPKVATGSTWLPQRFFVSCASFGGRERERRVGNKTNAPPRRILRTIRSTCITRGMARQTLTLLSTWMKEEALSPCNNCNDRSYRVPLRICTHLLLTSSATRPEQPADGGIIFFRQ